jgi:hypothetical protein
MAAVVHSNLSNTIYRALKNAADAQGDSKSMGVLRWLLAAARQHQQQQQQHDGLAGQLQLDAASLLLVPHVPAAAARTLVAAGLLINKQQLCAAAAHQVAGLEVWLQAHETLNVPNVLLPGWAHGICLNSTKVRWSQVFTLKLQHRQAKYQPT